MTMINYLRVAILIVALGLGAYLDRLYMNTVLSKEVSAHNETRDEFKTAVNLAEKRSNFLSTSYQEQLNEASKIAKQEAQASKTALLNATAVNGRLHNTIATLNSRITEAAREAVEEYATVSGELLLTCSRRLMWYATEADGHKIDANELSNAWPKNPD